MGASKKGRPPWLFPVLGVALIGVAAALWTLVHPVDQKPETAGGGEDFAGAIRRLAARREVPRSRIAEDDPIRKEGAVFVRTWKVAVTQRSMADALASDILAEASQRGLAHGYSQPATGSVASVRIDSGVEAFDIRFLLKKEVAIAAPTAVANRSTPTVTAAATPRPPARASGTLAILLDDAGQNMDLIWRAGGLPSEVGVAVLPFLPASSESAKLLHRAGHEIWLHLPMEPAGYPEENPGPGAVFVGMAEDEVRKTVRAAIKNIPYAVGVNNHMGSKATTDFRTMTWVMREIKERGLAFIDSRTAVDTIAEDAARTEGVPTGRRHVFLDNDRTPPAIRPTSTRTTITLVEIGSRPFSRTVISRADAAASRETSW